MATDTGSKRLASSPANRDDKKAKGDNCLVCLKPATDDIFECIWCEGCQHRECTKISANQCHVLNNIVKNIVFFCTTCLQRLPYALQSCDHQVHVNSNVLDIFITDRPSLVESCDTVDGISDHEAVFIESLVTAHLTLPSRRTIYLWSQADLQNVKNRTGSLCEEFVSSYSSSIPVEILWNNFVRICDTCLDLVPTKLSSSSFKQPWITTHIKRLSRRKQRAYNCARKTNQAHQWSNYYTLKENVNGNVVLPIINMCLIWWTQTRM